MAGVRARPTDVPNTLVNRPDLVGAQRAIAYRLPYPGASALAAEQWARMTFEGAPAVIRWVLVTGFRFVLGLRLSMSAADHVLGWPVSDSSATSLTLRADSVLVDGFNVVDVDDSGVTWTTLVRYRRGFAWPVWRTVELVHRVLMPYILTHSLRVLDRSARPPTSSPRD